MDNSYERTMPVKYILNMKIGIFYDTIFFRDKVFKEILSQIPKDCLEHIRGGNNPIIQLKTGVTIYFLSYSNNVRGYRFDRIFYEEKPKENDMWEFLFSRMSTARYVEPLKIEFDE